MEKDSKTTVAVERTTFTKLDRLAKANSVSKMEYITHAINYFEKYGINPVVAGASTQITISLSSLLSEEKFRRFLKENSELFIEVMNQSSEKGKAIDRAERAVRDSDATIRKNQQAIFKRIEANETAQLKAMQHIVSFLDAKGKTGLLDDINKVYEREKERRGL